MGTTRHYWPMCGALPASATATTTAMNTSLIAMTSIFSASVTGTIDRVFVHCASVLSPPVYVVGIESVSGGNPSGSLISAGASQTFTPSASTSHLLTLGTSVSITRGQLYAVTLRYSSGTIGTSNRGTFRQSITNQTGFGGNFEYPGAKLTTDGSIWSITSNSVPMLCPVYADGSFEIGCVGYISNTSISFSTSGVTDIGCRFTSPMSCTCVGALISVGALSASAPRTLQLLDTSGTILASSSQPANASATLSACFLFGTPASITDGTDYRLALAATTSTAQSINRNNCYSSAANSSLHGNCYHTQRSGGTWTDSTDVAPLVVPLFASPVSSSGGGSTVSYYVG